MAHPELVRALNMAQMAPDADGWFTLVVAHEDPGIHNWHAAKPAFSAGSPSAEPPQPESSPPKPTDGETMEPDLERTLRELGDRQAIWNVLLRYARGLDRIDAELVRGCYFDDAIEDHGHFVGTPDDFVTWACGVSHSFVTTQHGLLNHYCELAGDDAYCETYFLFSGVKSEPPHFLSTGRYVDHFQRRNGEWRIANRVTVVEGKFDVAEAAVSVAMPSAYGPGEAEPGRRDRDDVSYLRPPRPRQPR